MKMTQPRDIESKGIKSYQAAMAAFGLLQQLGRLVLESQTRQQQPETRQMGLKTHHSLRVLHQLYS